MDDIPDRLKRTRSPARPHDRPHAHPHGRPRINAEAALSPRRVFVEGFRLMGSVGVYEHEQQKPQPVIVTLVLDVLDHYDGRSDALCDVYDYDIAIAAVREAVDAGHVNLIETLAESIAAACLEDDRVFFARVRIEKPAVLEASRSVGIEIARGTPFFPVG